MIALQLDFFKTKEEVELDEMRKMFNNLFASSEKVRKGLYARWNEEKKERLELQARIEILEKNICNGIIMVEKM